MRTKSNSAGAFALNSKHFGPAYNILNDIGFDLRVRAEFASDLVGLFHTTLINLWLQVSLFTTPL